MVHKGKLAELEIPQIVELMLGRKMEEEFPKYQIDAGDVMLKVENLNSAGGEIHDISFYVRRGEIIGIAGLVGAGKSELCKTLFGDMKASSGQITLNGKPLHFKNPCQAVRDGIALVPEERRKEGIMVNAPVYSNLTAASLDRFCNKIQFIKKKQERIASRKVIEDLGIKTPNDYRLVKYLSGGNQQKVAIGKWLIADADVYIFDEPTKGIDVGAKSDVYELIGQLAKRGKCVVYASCESAEILGITDRVYVMYDGTISKELETAKTSESEILYYSIGGASNEHAQQEKAELKFV